MLGEMRFLQRAHPGRSGDVHRQDAKSAKQAYAPALVLLACFASLRWIA